ncbi:MAG: hypothetical protein ACERKZ_05765 [Lachnotalea sp.]
MTKEELKQIYNLNKEAEMWQRELNKLESMSLVKGQEITDMPRCSGTSDKVGDLAIEKVEIESIIKGKLAEIQLQRKKIMEYIDNVEDSTMRQIIYLRNVCCASWNEVANSVGGNSTEYSVRKKYSRFLKK